MSLFEKFSNIITCLKSINLCNYLWLRQSSFLLYFWHFARFQVQRKILYNNEFLFSFEIFQEVTGDDDSDLYLEEREMELKKAQEEKRRIQMAVPGMLNPHVSKPLPSVISKN